MTRPDRWRDRAACRDRPDIDWHPATDRDAAAAVAVCMSCPVQVDCLADADRTETAVVDVYGVRGGLTQGARRRRSSTLPQTAAMCPECGAGFRSRQALAMHRVKRHAWVAACGTPAGRARHQRTGEPLCPQCRAAHATATRESRRLARQEAG